MTSSEIERVINWVGPKSRVLDLGCGDGQLLARLRDERQVRGYGLEICLSNVTRCVAAGVNVLHADLDDGLDRFDDDAFDMVILLQTLPAVRYPARLLTDMFRVGREGVVTFPNFAHWRARVQLALSARMPVTPALPAQWYDTPNIHLCTLHDFEALCRRLGVEVVERVVFGANRREGGVTAAFPALLAETALYRLRRHRD